MNNAVKIIARKTGNDEQYIENIIVDMQLEDEYIFTQISCNTDFINLVLQRLKKVENHDLLLNDSCSGIS